VRISSLPETPIYPLVGPATMSFLFRENCVIPLHSSIITNRHHTITATKTSRYEDLRETGITLDQPVNNTSSTGYTRLSSPMTSSPPRTHPNKQYPTPAMSTHSDNAPSSPPPYASSFSSPTATSGLGLQIPAEKNWATVSLDPESAVSSHGLMPPARRSRAELVSLTISRCRFVLRLVSCILSMLIVGLMGTSYSAFFATKGHRLIYAGEPIWPDKIDLTASNCLLAVGAITATSSLVVLVAGIWPKIRHVTKTGDLVALTTCVVNFTLAVGAATFFWVFRSDDELRVWTCEHRLVNHPQAGFGTMCTGMCFSFAIAWGIAVVEGLTMANVALGCFARRRASGSFV